MEHKVGDYVRVVHPYSGGEFVHGDIVKIERIGNEDEDDCYGAISPHDGYMWYLNEDEVEEYEKDPLTIWFITVFEKIVGLSSGLIEFGDRYTWGFYADRNKAVEALHNNCTDMHEGIYHYALIEARDEGIANYHDTGEEQWFMWDSDREGFYEINRPECLDGYCGFAL